MFDYYRFHICRHGHHLLLLTLSLSLYRFSFFQPSDRRRFISFFFQSNLFLFPFERLEFFVVGLNRNLMVFFLLSLTCFFLGIPIFNCCTSRSSVFTEFFSQFYRRPGFRNLMVFLSSFNLFFCCCCCRRLLQWVLAGFYWI